MNKLFLICFLLISYMACGQNPPIDEHKTLDKKDSIKLAVKNHLDSLNKIIEKKFPKYPFNLKSDSINYSLVRFNNKVWIGMNLKTLLKFYPNTKLKNIKIEDGTGDEITEKFYYFYKNSYVSLGMMYDTTTKKYAQDIVQNVNVKDSGIFLNVCPKAQVGSSISILEKCFPNSYNANVKWIFSLTEEEFKNEYKNYIGYGSEKILFVKINYPSEEQLPLNLLYYWDIKTKKITKIETKYESY